MIRAFHKTFSLMKQIFTTTHYEWMQFTLILIVSLAFIWMPQGTPSDWDLNIIGFWSNIPQTYLNNQNFVYPPWGLILLLPYYLLHAVGARVFSVLIIGWLTYKREWPLSLFFAIVLSPYFMATMSKSNMDILVILLPILIWEYLTGKRWEIIFRGICLSIMLIKPQCTLFIIFYLIWKNRKEWKKVIVYLAIVALFVIPISFIGSPPLLIQWLNNITHPSPQNQYYWSINNISLTAKFNFGIALGILTLIILVLFLLIKAKVISWKNDQTIFSLLLFSMYLLPYTSQQSLSSGLAFIPSWPGLFIQWLGIGLGFVTFGFNKNIALWTFSVSLLSLLFYSFLRRRDEKRAESLAETQPDNP
jgi:hypothetical protein